MSGDWGKPKPDPARKLPLKAQRPLPPLSRAGAEAVVRHNKLKGTNFRNRADAVLRRFD